MPVFVALIRAINVGGRGLLSMRDLSALCEAEGFRNVRTYLQSGNVIFESSLPVAKVQSRLEAALAQKMGKRPGVILRGASELRAVLDGNPFPGQPPAKMGVLFLAAAAPKDELEALSGPAGEQVRTGCCEVYVYYPDGMGRSKLKLPASVAAGTMRNINTVSKLVSMADGE